MIAEGQRSWAGLAVAPSWELLLVEGVRVVESRGTGGVSRPPGSTIAAAKPARGGS